MGWIYPRRYAQDIMYMDMGKLYKEMYAQHYFEPKLWTFLKSCNVTSTEMC